MKTFFTFMALNNTRGHDFPQDAADQSPRPAVARIVKALDTNRASVERWFWKGLLAFNLLLASVVFWVGIVPRLL